MRDVPTRAGFAASPRGDVEREDSQEGVMSEGAHDPESGQAGSIDQSDDEESRELEEREQGGRREEIARRAYEISLGAEGGTPEENWRRAEEELAR